jgi:hypothetical protein
VLRSFSAFTLGHKRGENATRILIKAKKKMRDGTGKNGTARNGTTKK